MGLLMYDFMSLMEDALYVYVLYSYLINKNVVPQCLFWNEFHWKMLLMICGGACMNELF